MKLKVNRRYSVLRVHEDTAFCAQGDSFTIHYSKGQWCITEDGESIYRANASTFQNPKYWEIEYELDEDDLNAIQEKEYSMSFVNEELLIEQDVTLVNGQKLDKFSDSQLIKMIKAEREKMHTLGAEIGSLSKYYLAKEASMSVNIKILADELDRRVTTD